MRSTWPAATICSSTEVSDPFSIWSFNPSLPNAPVPMAAMKVAIGAVG